MTVLPSYVEVNNIQIRMDSYLMFATAQAGYVVKTVGFKRDLRFFNDSPWSLKPKQAFSVKMWDRAFGYIDMGVYQIWESENGFSIKVEYFETIEEYNSYNPSGESPDAINREIGLCKNYEKGI